MKKTRRPKSIDDYLVGVEPQKRAALQKLRSMIWAALPAAEECISYSIPAFRLDGRIVAVFAATKSGCSYFPFSGATLGTMVDQIKRYERTKSSLHFDPANGLPQTLVRKLLRARIAEDR